MIEKPNSREVQMLQEICLGDLCIPPSGVGGTTVQGMVSKGWCVEVVKDFGSAKFYKITDLGMEVFSRVPTQ